jgi:hypothetical protein
MRLISAGWRALTAAARLRAGTPAVGALRLAADPCALLFRCMLSQVRGIPDSCLSAIQRPLAYPVIVPISNRDTYVIVCER